MPSVGRRRLINELAAMRLGWDTCGDCDGDGEW